MNKLEKTSQSNDFPNNDTIKQEKHKDVGSDLEFSKPTASCGRELSRSTTQFHHFRYVVVFLAGLMMGYMLFLRVNIAIAILSMVNKTAIYLIEHPNSTAEEYFAPDYVERGEFIWNNEIQQIIMTGYMLAYTIPQTFTTRLAMKYGVRPSIAISLAICSISNLLTPIMAYWGWQWVLFLRLLNALGASAILPSMVNVIEEFMPYEDAPTGVAIFQFTEYFLYIITPLVSGILTSIHWKWAFYVPGLGGLVISLIWYLLASNNAQSSRFIGQKELDLITGYSADPSKQGNDSVKSKKGVDLPWYFMFKIKSFYGLSVIWTLNCSAATAFLFLMPKYFDKIMAVPIDDVGLMNFTVQLASWFCMLWPAPLTSYLMKKFDVSLTTARHLIIFICSSLTALTFIYLGLFHDHLVLVSSINRFFNMTIDSLVMATVMSQFGKAGVSGLVYSMINAIGNLSTILLCWAAGRYLDYTGESLECWSWILYFLAALMILHFMVYVTCCHSRAVSIEAEQVQSVEDGRKV